MAGRKKSEDDSKFYWIFTLIMLMTVTPIGFIMAASKLWDMWQEGKLPVPGQTSPAASTATAPKRRSARTKGKDPMAPLANKGKRRTLTGILMSAICGFVAVTVLGDAAHWLLDGEVKWFLEEALEILPFLFGLAGGVGFLWSGRGIKKQLSRFRGYLAMIGQQKAVSIPALASAAGTSPRKVREDLADMLEQGLFPHGFLDYGNDRLVLSSEGLGAQPGPRPKAQPTPEEAENALLAEIRAVNDLVQNEKLSAQIDQIRLLTAKILDYEKSHPQAAPQLHSFLSYYLPTTLKILRAYGQLEAQEVAGDNITAAMRRIENMMDKVVEGFEKQLDQLFLGETMDITSDVAVLEQMLAKDGLSGTTLSL